MNEVEMPWFQAMNEEGPLAVKTLEEARRLDKTAHLPLMAFISYLTGDPAGDVHALHRFWENLVFHQQSIPCRACAANLSYAGGIGHEHNCPIVLKAANYVIEIGDLEQKRLKKDLETRLALDVTTDYAMVEKLDDSK